MTPSFHTFGVSGKPGAVQGLVDAAAVALGLLVNRLGSAEALGVLTVAANSDAEVVVNGAIAGLAIAGSAEAGLALQGLKDRLDDDTLIDIGIDEHAKMMRLGLEGYYQR